MLAQQGSIVSTLRTDLRGSAKAVLLRSSFKGGAPFSRKSLLRSVGLHKSLCLETCFSFDTIGLSLVWPLRNKQGFYFFVCLSFF
jgi:hypothetical protein